jgi:hypothetical protein
MRSSTKRKSPEQNSYFICEKCRYQFAYRQMSNPKRFRNSVREIKSLYDQKILGQEAYQDLIRLIISAYVTNEISTNVCEQLDVALTEKLSPDRFLQALI